MGNPFTTQFPILAASTTIKAPQGRCPSSEECTYVLRSCHLERSAFERLPAGASIALEKFSSLNSVRKTFDAIEYATEDPWRHQRICFRDWLTCACQNNSAGSQTVYCLMHETICVHVGGGLTSCSLFALA